MKVYYSEEPQKIKYEPLPDGTANVYLRKDIKQEEIDATEPSGEEKKMRVWTAEEANFRTGLTEVDVNNHFDDLFFQAGKKPTLEERVSALEDFAVAMAGGTE